ncbi:hypothetical protein GLOIN_2v1770348 [Rhizophagus irregularis DAOM 181602=DAOM 197198]|uniref:Uncharacterized protein n=1 Tax=Rhizophagus irregularis (strain DAOM 181602 / DAOM 197198 / MUCL 43194) TaxID=747089 RepID=A0A2P4QCE4_RHIID|nr:hypothetical protein GLOIN_2v1770348 [Rhizophagus irregularis DAOM 181602=DAOM 197198]POG75299.1 hypothetical protein GLOIN_2v1770348 [Rhizophagus irregularis DAOM 181602=DAOM 197198]|eukprot:XP_025182165.1 hypothetical protein GLOIN_2v1770348 [Rhizophagus irregularis DAOM 181602=DAOM 197198]
MEFGEIEFSEMNDSMCIRDRIWDMDMGYGIWGYGILDMGYGIWDWNFGMGLWDMGWDDRIWDGIWDFPIPLIWVASIDSPVLKYSC